MYVTAHKRRAFESERPGGERLVEIGAVSEKKQKGINILSSRLGSSVEDLCSN